MSRPWHTEPRGRPPPPGTHSYRSCLERYPRFTVLKQTKNRNESPIFFVIFFGKKKYTYIICSIDPLTKQIPILSFLTPPSLKQKQNRLSYCVIAPWVLASLLVSPLTQFQIRRKGKLYDGVCFSRVLPELGKLLVSPF